jgi:hypothetical protein
MLRGVAINEIRCKKYLSKNITLFTCYPLNRNFHRKPSTVLQEPSKASQVTLCESAVSKCAAFSILLFQPALQPLVGFRPSQLSLSILSRKVLQSSVASGTSNPELRGDLLHSPQVTNGRLRWQLSSVSAEIYVVNVSFYHHYHDML